MIAYRCYFVDRLNQVDDTSVIHAGNDGDAIGFAIAQLEASRCVAVEVWDGARRVAHRPRLELASIELA